MLAAWESPIIFALKNKSTFKIAYYDLFDVVGRISHNNCVQLCKFMNFEMWSIFQLVRQIFRDKIKIDLFSEFKWPFKQQKIFDWTQKLPFELRTTYELKIATIFEWLKWPVMTGDCEEDDRVYLDRSSKNL